MIDYKQKYEDLLRDIDLAITGQKEGETKIVLQNIKERNTERDDDSIIMAIKEAVNSYWSDDTHAITDILTWLEKQGEKKGIVNNQSDFVDFGLPSGALWAKCNLGAEKETDFGLFYQWGDTQGYSGVDENQFKRNDYKRDNSGNISKYNEVDNKLVLDNEDDPVFVATNGKFKSPTREQLQELINHTDHEWIENFEGSGVNGMMFINKNDDTKYIFIPAAGDCYAGRHHGVGSWGYVWSASRYMSSAYGAWYMYFYAGDLYMNVFSRCSGYSVRGVLNKDICK